MTRSFTGPVWKYFLFNPWRKLMSKLLEQMVFIVNKCLLRNVRTKTSSLGEKYGLSFQEKVKRCKFLPFEPNKLWHWKSANNLWRECYSESLSIVSLSINFYIIGKLLIWTHLLYTNNSTKQCDYKMKLMKKEYPEKKKWKSWAWQCTHFR